MIVEGMKKRRQKKMKENQQEEKKREWKSYQFEFSVRKMIIEGRKN